MNKDVRALKYDFLNLASRMQAKSTALATWLLTQVSQLTVHTNIIMYMQLYILVYIINIIFKIYYNVN